MLNVYYTVHHSWHCYLIPTVYPHVNIQPPNEPVVLLIHWSHSLYYFPMFSLVCNDPIFKLHTYVLFND